jgi:anti-sigma factor RsiW
MCLEARRLLDAYVDHELESADAADVQTHLVSCAACCQLLADVNHSAGWCDACRTIRVGSAAREDPRRASARRRVAPSLLAWAAGVGACGVVRRLSRVARFARAKQVVETTASVANEVVGDHVRALSNAHLFDVQSSDQHTVKPWFLGKLDFSPPVEDLSPIGFPLVGGRVDRVAGQPVAALVYQRHLHPITVFISSAIDRTAVSDARSIRGFQIRHWIRNDMSFWAVSDLNDAELDELVRALQR